MAVDSAGPPPELQQHDTDDPENLREGEATAAMAFPAGLVTFGDRYQQPGVLRAGPRYDGAPHQRKTDEGFYIADIASDKFAVLTHVVDSSRSYQLLPAEYARKRARIIVPVSQPNVPSGTQTATPGNPAAGANLSTVLNTRLPVTILSVSYTLTTAVAVANRLANVVAGGSYSAGVAQTASLVETYNFAPGNPLTTVLPGSGGTLTAPIPAGLTLAANTPLTTSIANLQAADQISAVSIQYQVNTSSVGVIIADQPTVEQALAQVASAATVTFGFPLYVGAQPPFDFTSRQGLYCASLTSGLGVVVNTMTEKFESGVPIS